MTSAHLLASAVLESNLTPQILAIAVGMSDARIGALLHGDPPTLDEARQLAAVLCREPSELFPAELAMSNPSVTTK